MRIVDRLESGRRISFEVFPPKPQDDADMAGIFATIDALSAAEPDFISVTYSPAGRNRARALEIAERVGKAGSLALSHFTAVGYAREDVDSMLEALAARGIRNILALRGDLPPGLEFPEAPWRDFRYAIDLIRYVRAKEEGLCVGAACYPEGHPETLDPALDLRRLREKVDAGADFLITQLSFDDEAVLRYLDRVRGAGIRVPVLVGIMPVLAAKSIRRMIQLTGCAVPPALANLIEKYGEEPASMEAAGVEFAAGQIGFLRARGVDGVHLYSMNKAAQSLAILAAAALS